mmetsp:Transcript_3203/g.8673  ORF Transcript_3203/g.8673 Transcript_3203/m.8673 type:complete len:194 (+) Transcript_3203:158-739(+)|eukprot:CAMPEP_0119123388 /NCGR_PEP_ID=MMETSP1310-20130426/3343_1 /TAXON_ID=464262 /ORGANISM="Genus nov. species nov., Strain RCC2339" /LENGTH=193 /DNA_ID=CAMNT_0007113183 /DNA_START=151 /DNA_END=732 /DNA_ORIENTATION=-
MAGVAEKCRRDLYGGAMELSVPERFDDVSPFRPIPDNQEVFSDPPPDQSVVVELMEWLGEVEMEPSIRRHFEEIAATNKASSFEVLLIEPVRTVPDLGDPAAKGILCAGRQRVSKYRETEEHEILVLLCCYRMPAYTTDFLISYNAPLDRDVKNPAEFHNLLESDPGWNDKHMTFFREMVETARLKDPGLFSC